jgi:hypothetical protein
LLWRKLFCLRSYFFPEGRPHPNTDQGRDIKAWLLCPNLWQHWCQSQLQKSFFELAVFQLHFTFRITPPLHPVPSFVWLLIPKVLSSKMFYIRISISNSASLRI